MKTQKTTTVAFRISEELRSYFEQRAAADRRNLSDILRRALEDQAAFLRLSETKPKRAGKATPTGAHSLM